MEYICKKLLKINNACLTVDVIRKYGVPIVNCVENTNKYMEKYFTNKAIYSQKQYDDLSDEERTHLIIGCNIHVSPKHTTALRTLDTWDMSICPDASGMFHGCDIQSNIGGWDMSSCENMDEMFINAKGDISGIENWDVHNVHSMEGTFCKFNGEIPEIGKWNTRNLRSIKSLFYKYTGKIPKSIGDWDTSNVRNMSNVFSWAHNPPASIGKWDTRNVSDISAMFDNCSGKIPESISGWDTRNIVNIGRTFYDSYVPKCLNWNLDKVEYSYNVVRNADGGTQFFRKFISYDSDSSDGSDLDMFGEWKRRDHGTRTNPWYSQDDW